MSETFDSREELIQSIENRLEELHVDPAEFDLTGVAAAVEEFAGGYPISRDVLKPNGVDYSDE